MQLVQGAEDVRTGKTANCSSAERKYQKGGSLLATWHSESQGLSLQMIYR